MRLKAASPSVICYPQPSKQKSLLLLESFAAGCGGKMARSLVYEPEAASVFFGVIGLEGLFRQAREGEWIYGDNAYVDRARGEFYRFTKNAFQPSILLAPDYARLKALDIRIQPWRTGRHVVVVDQSEHFNEISGAGKEWLAQTVAEVKRHTDRKIVVRQWSRNKTERAASLQADLEEAHCTVGWMSAALNESLCFGVPTFALGPCAASPLSLSDLSKIESPIYPDNRSEWSAGLAGAQWTIEEIKRGDCWRALCQR